MKYTKKSKGAKMFFDFLNVVVGSGFDFLKGFVCGGILGFIGYHFFIKNYNNYLREDLKRMREERLELQTFYKNELDQEKQRHKHIEDNFKIIIADCLKQKSKQE